MAITISDNLARAQRSYLSVPTARVRCYRPGYPETKLDLSPYLVDFEVTLPPNMAAGYAQLTVTNPNNVISLHSLFKPDYVLDVELGYYSTLYGTDYVQVGRFYIDEPQREFSINPPKNTVIIQARDGYKVMMERNFEQGEFIDFFDITVQEAIEQTVGLLNGITVPISYDTDAETVAALAVTVDSVFAAPQDQTKDCFQLLQQVLTVGSGLRAYFRGDGTLRVGMMNEMNPANAVATLGGVSSLARPIFGRNHRRSGREHFNWVHVEGDTIYADVYDQDRITDIGRRKYLFIDDPEMTTVDQATQRARQALDDATRFVEQPDVVVNWLLDLERRDLITIDDGGITGLPRDVYRIEDIRYHYTAGASPQMDMQLGMGLPGATDTTESGGSFL